MRQTSASVARGSRRVLEHVPDHDFVEECGGVAGIREARGDTNLRPRVGAARGRGIRLDAMGLEAALRDFAQQDAATAAHVEDPGRGSELSQKEAHVATTDQPD